MKKTLLMLALSASFVAQATNIRDGECRGNCAPNTPGVTPNVTVTPNISPDIRNTNTNLVSTSANQAQHQGQVQGQTATGGNASATGGAGGNATATTSSNASGGTAQSVSSSSNQGVSTTVNNVSTAPSDIKVRSVGAAPDILTTPTAPCRIAVGVSGGWIGGALGFGTSVEDEGCTLRENARLLHNFGEKAAALKLMCNDAKVAAVLSICPAPAAAPQTEVSVKP